MKKLLAILFCCYVATSSYAAQTVYLVNESTDTVSFTTGPTCGTNPVLRVRVNWAGANYSFGTVAPLGTSAGQTYSAGTLYLFITGHSGGEYLHATYTIGTTGSQNITVPGSVGCTPTSDPSTNLCNVTLCAKNNDVIAHNYSFWKAGVPMLMNGDKYGNLYLAPGATGCATVQLYCTNATGWYLDYTPADIEDGYKMENVITNSTIVTNGAATYPASTNSATAQDPVIYTPGQSNILFTSSSYTNSITSQQQGDSAIKAAIDAAALGNLSALQGVSNAIAGLGDKDNGSTGVTNAIDRFRQQNTNLLSQILTNLSRGTNFVPDATGTNQTAATTAGESAVSAATSDIDDWVTGLGTSPEGSLASAGSPDVFSFAFAGRTIDLNPETHLPGVMGVCKTLVTMVVMILFGMSVSRMFYEVVRTFSTAQTGGVPDLNFVGVNVAGVAAAPIVSGIFIAIWVVALVGFIAAVVAAMTGFASSMTAAAGVSLPAGTSYLLYQSLPVTLIISLAFSRILLWLMAAKVVAIASAISRFLIGK